MSSFDSGPLHWKEVLGFFAFWVATGAVFMVVFEIEKTRQVVGDVKQDHPPVVVGYQTIPAENGIFLLVPERVDLEEKDESGPAYD